MPMFRQRMHFVIVSVVAAVTSMAVLGTKVCGDGECAATAETEVEGIKVSMLQRGNKAATRQHEHASVLEKRRAEIIAELAEIGKTLATDGEPAPELSKDAHARSQSIFVNNIGPFHAHSTITIGPGINSEYTVTNIGGTPADGPLVHLGEPLRIAYPRGTPVCADGGDPRCNGGGEGQTCGSCDHAGCGILQSQCDPGLTCVGEPNDANLPPRCQGGGGSNGGGEGQTCGSCDHAGCGIMQSQCDPGLTCVGEPNDANLPPRCQGGGGSNGGGKGQTCGNCDHAGCGIMQSQCAPGLTCVGEPNDANLPPRCQ